MKVLVTGASGLLGRALCARPGVVGLSRKELDVTDPAAISAVLAVHAPDLVVNCAAFVRVDDAEKCEPEALAVNGTAVGLLGAACARRGVRLVQISTDYVFDGTAAAPYPEDAPTSPLNAYGRTKLAGEQAALAHDAIVLRSAWLYGSPGPDFVHTMIRLAAERDTVSVVADQHGQPTWTSDLADRVLALSPTTPPGIYHATSSGETTWHALAQEVFTLLGQDPARVLPCTTADFPRPATRPARTVLGHDAWAEAGLGPMRDWRVALHAAWPSLLPQG